MAHTDHNKEMRFQNQIAVVTGAGRGIGKETAKILFQGGARVALVSRTGQELRSAIKDFVSSKNGRGDKANLLAIEADISKEKSVKSLFERVKSEWGSVTILVNNAGWIKPTPLLEMTPAIFDQHFAINTRGTFLCTHSAFEQMSRSGQGGTIVNVISLAGIRGTEKFVGFSAYTGAKSAVTGLTEAWALEGKSFGIRVNAVAPGATDTKMLKQAAPGLKTKTKPEDIAKMIAFFCDASESGKITGSILEVHSNE